MTEPKHTPAPWKVYYAKKNGQVILGVGDADGQGIIAYNGSFWGDDAESKANSEHVVKCVNCHDELLSEMQKLAKALEDTGHEPEQSFYDAIAKARGEA